MNDLINPTHYKLPNGIEVIDVLEKELTKDELNGYLKGNALKYSFRAGKKQHITPTMVEEFTKTLPNGNVTLLKDDVVMHFNVWVNSINKAMENTDNRKRDWYFERLLLGGRSFKDWVLNIINIYK